MKRKSKPNEAATQEEREAIAKNYQQSPGEKAVADSMRSLFGISDPTQVKREVDKNSVASKKPRRY